MNPKIYVMVRIKTIDFPDAAAGLSIGPMDIRDPLLAPAGRP